jgi:hemoglobin-like flavoprotein
MADPELRALFKGDMLQQGERLMSMIGTAVQLLDQPQTLLPALRGLGKRHGGYGVRDSHYATVGGALLATLDAGLGAEFTPEVREAWTAMYAIVSREMIAAAR